MLGELTFWALIGLILAGVAIGVAGGMLGIGGGVIAVPALLEIFAHLPVQERLALAIGTAQAVILLSSLTAIRAHWRGGGVEPALLRAWLPAMILGGLLGLALAPFAPAALSLKGFALIAILLGAKLWLGAGLRPTHGLPARPWGWLPPGLIGLASAALGVGAGTLSGPVLGLFGVGLHRAIGAGGVFNLAIAAPATLLALFLGQVSLLGVVLLALPAMLVAPAAAGLGRRLPQRRLEQGFAFCLFALAARLVWRALSEG